MSCNDESSDLFSHTAQSAYFERLAQSTVAPEQEQAAPPAREEETITSCPVAGDEADDVSFLVTIIAIFILKKNRFY